MLNCDNYEDAIRLGSGAFGVVYRVRSKINDKFYAIKKQKLDSSDRRSLVMNEVDVLKGMPRHKNVIRYYGSWEDSGAAYILMEYASSGSLEYIMRERGRRFSEKTALFIFAQIILGVNHIHREAIIHRDLKPANILVQKVVRGNGRRMDIIKIGDFGISKDTQGTWIAETLAGTKRYCAPEVFNETLYDSRCDMWSCGIILYELLTNNYPFGAMNEELMMWKIQEGLVNEITWDDISQDSLTMIDNLLRVNPTRRWRSRDIVGLPRIKEYNDRVSDHLDEMPENHRCAWCSRSHLTFDESMRGLPWRSE